MVKISEELITNKLMNTSTTQSHKYSPHNIISNLSSSRTSKWTTKFAKFQKINEKREKKNINISTPLETTSNLQFQRSFSTKSLNDINKTENMKKITFSSENLKKTSSLSENLSQSKTSVVKGNLREDSVSKNYSPLESSFSSNFTVELSSKCDLSKPSTPRNLPISRSIPNRSKRSFIKEKCTLCNESISNKSIGERIMELECKHLCHEECLSVSIDNLSTTTSLNLHSLFPQCNKCFEEKGQVRKCIPKNEDLKDRLLSNILMNTSSSSPITFQSIDTPTQTGFSTFTTPINKVQSQFIFQQSPTSISQSSNQEIFNISLADPPMKKFSLGSFNTNNNIYNLQFATLENSKEDQIRESRNESFGLPCFDERIIHSNTDVVSDITTNHNTSLNLTKEQLPIIRSFFTQLLLENFRDNLSDWQLDEEFGLLRIVDKLLVSYDNSDYITSWCFLFSRTFVIAFVDEPSYISSDNIISETKLRNLIKFDNLKDINVQTIDSSTLLVSEHNNTSLFSEKKAYLKQSLINNSSNILQKWISGLLDNEMIFNEKNITSTLKLPLILKSKTTDDDNSKTFTSLINPKKIIELSSLKRSSGNILLRRSILIEKNNQKNNAADTLLSMKTSISSIISFKREKPDELFIVLQVDFNKLNDNNDYYTIVNTLKALNLALPQSKLCIVNHNGYVLKSFFSINEHINVGCFKELVEVCSMRKFDPLLLKKELYPSTLNSNIGIVVISNSAMKEESSCLMKNYSCFNKIGRHTPNELKIKVGYLNIDYSSKIEELFEVNTWDCVLETICYSYNITFESDDNYGIDSMFSERYSFNNGSIFFEKTEDNDNKSIMTLHISTPVVTNPDTFFCKSAHSVNNCINNSASLGVSNNLTEKTRDSFNRGPNMSKEIPLSNTTDSYNIILNQIDKTIKDIQNHNTVKTEGAKKDKEFYEYI